MTRKQQKDDKDSPQKEGSFDEKRVNIALKEKVHAQAKIISTLRKIPLNKFLEEAIEEAVKKDKHLLEELLK
jgi:predicted HicB family RNase H-like nuclease